LKLNHDELLSNFACFGFNFNRRPSTMIVVRTSSIDTADTLVRAVQVDPRLTLLAFRDFQRLKQNHDKQLSNDAFTCSLRHYTLSPFVKMIPRSQW